jgi:Fe-S-cluster-containing dehydrogenase component
LTRRQFLCRSTGICATAAVWAAGARIPVSLAASPAEGPDQIGVLVDLTRCIGCRACVRACDAQNHLPHSEPPKTVWQGSAETLSFNRWTMVNLEGEASGGRPVPVKQQCLHCLDPACVSVCPVGAMRRLPSGAVVYRADRCIGCRYCMLACPFGIPKFEWSASTAPTIGKCQFCAQQAVFSGPACAAACPTGTLKFGSRPQLLFEAKARVHSRPDRYVGHIYGEHEAGGTAWMYLSGTPFDQLGFAKVPERSLPSFTRMALEIIPWIVTVLAVVLSAASYCIPGRKQAAEKMP